MHVQFFALSTTSTYFCGCFICLCRPLSKWLCSRKSFDIKNKMKLYLSCVSFQTRIHWFNPKRLIFSCTTKFTVRFYSASLASILQTILKESTHMFKTEANTKELLTTIVVTLLAQRFTIQERLVAYFRNLSSLKL